MLEGMIDQEKGEHIIFSIEKIMMGGIYDHLRGGIHRYTSDDAWMEPHFEKMLYDQAGLLKLLSKTTLIYPSPILFDALLQTLDYLEKEMLDDTNYFFSSQNAESEEINGLYYTFTKDEFRESLKENLDKESTEKIEDILTWFLQGKEGSCIKDLSAIGLDYNMKDNFYTQDNWELMRKAKTALLKTRKVRIPPTTDTKGVASWNFLLTNALADVIQYCRIDTIKHQALSLFKKAISGRYDNFIKNIDSATIQIKHSTTLERSTPLFEDYVFFAQSELRIYEISGIATHKDNFFNTVNFIFKEFYKDDYFFTRTIQSSDYELFPNQKQSPFDNTFCSPVPTYIQLSMKAAVLFKNPELIDRISDLIDKVINEALFNPLNCGEVLKCLTYPKEAYKVVEVPKEWIQNTLFTNFLSFFMPRFVFNFHELNNNSFSISSIETCEISGSGLDEFKKCLEANLQAPEDSEESNS